jgi:hypothetical protein
MEPVGSSPQPKQPATCPYPDPDQPVYVIPSYLSYIDFKIILPSTSRSSN